MRKLLWVVLFSIILMSYSGASAVKKPCSLPGCDDHSGDFTFNDNLMIKKLLDSWKGD